MTDVVRHVVTIRRDGETVRDTLDDTHVACYFIHEAAYHKRTRADMFASLRKPSKIKDVDYQIHKRCAVSHAVPARIHGGWMVFRMSVIRGFHGT